MNFKIDDLKIGFDGGGSAILETGNFAWFTDNMQKFANTIKDLIKGAEISMWDMNSYENGVRADDCENVYTKEELIEILETKSTPDFADTAEMEFWEEMGLI